MLFFKKKSPTKVCFFVMYSSVFSAYPVFEYMLRNKRFDPFIVIIPDVMRGKDQLLKLLEQEYALACAKWDNVYKSYSSAYNDWIDFSSNCEIAFLPTIYKGHTAHFYTPEYLRKKKVKTCFLNYGYTVSNYGINTLLSGNVDVIFAESKTVENILKSRGVSVYCLGYPKNDNYSSLYKKSSFTSRKKIIIAPHHTIINWKNGVNLSNFLRYSDFFLKLPKLYPQIDFIYRPHQLLSFNLKHYNIWDSDRISNYVNIMYSYPNVHVSNVSENYFETFVNSDGLIHDCGSFMAEYLFSGNPACYMINEHTRQDLNEFGNKCVDMHYQAFNEEDIIKFIDNVILKGEDPMKKERRNFVSEELKINYPNSAKAICDYIKKELI